MLLRIPSNPVNDDIGSPSSEPNFPDIAVIIEVHDLCSIQLVPAKQKRYSLPLDNSASY